MDDLRAPGVLDAPDALVRLARAGDEHAFARIVRLHRDAMIRVALVVTLDPELAAEAAAASWPVAWARIAELDDPSRLEPWLCGIAAHEARDVAAHGSSRLDLQPPSDDASPWSSRPVEAAPKSAESFSDTALHAALGELQPDDRVYLALRLLGRLTPAEIGRATASQPVAADARAAQVARALARAVGQRPGPDPDEPTTDGRLSDRIRVFADVPVRHVNIDAVARHAKLTRHDRRTRLASLAIAAAIGAAVALVPLLGNPGPSSAWTYARWVPGAVPSPSIEAFPGNTPAPPATDATP
jgi:RNA polymerase sigma-70 factor (ECF subfamily)